MTTTRATTAAVMIDRADICPSKIGSLVLAGACAAFWRKMIGARPPGTRTGSHTLTGMTDMDQHVRGERFDVKHACPDCPTPLATLWQQPNPLCRWCHGTGLLTTQQLARWQQAQAA